MNDINSGTQFDFTYAPGTSSEQILGFEMAGEVWSSYLNDDVTISIYVESTNDLPEEVIGAALPGKKRKEKYDKVKNALSDDITSADDQLAFANLPSEDKEFSILVNGQQLDETKEFRITNANAKSLGLLNDERDKLDGYILVNDLTSNPDIAWDYNTLRNGSASGNEIDFLSVAMHEIGHVLGFVSGIDDKDWLNVLTESQDDDDDDDDGEIEDQDFKFASPLDLYRYSDSSPFSGEIDLSVGGSPFFSIDGGNSNLGNFANGEYTQFGGDGYQASHWQQYSSQGIMNPILPVGQRRDISSLDLTAIDVIGWDINTAAAPSWEEMYTDAVAGAENATIQNRDQDVEKLIQESGYNVRRSRSSSRARYFRQVGFWQFTTVGGVNEPEGILADESEIATEVEIVIAPDDVEQIQPEPATFEANQTQTNENQILNSTNPDTEESDIASNQGNNVTESVEVENSYDSQWSNDQWSNDADNRDDDDNDDDDNENEEQDSYSNPVENNYDSHWSNDTDNRDDDDDDDEERDGYSNAVENSDDIEWSNDTDNRDDDDDDDENEEEREYSNNYWYTPDYSYMVPQSQSITGIAGNEPDSLFY